MGRHEAPIPCEKHKPMQHRDGKPPWCRTCGRDATGRVPVSVIDKLRERNR